MNYKEYYLLSFFNLQEPTSSSQLLHIFQGKRTPSMLYLTEKNGWHHAFSQFKRITIEEIGETVQQFFQKEWLSPKEKGFVLTEIGFNELELYFNQRYFPKVNRFTNLNIRSSFWERYQLFAQTFSEMTYENQHYSPVIKHPHHQENVRLLFRQYPGQRKGLVKKWVEEQMFLFTHLEESHSNAIIAQLSGHKRIGETKSQLQEYLEMDQLEYALFHQDIIEEILNLIEEKSEVLVLLYAIVYQLHRETNYGLSSSTYISYELLKQGFDIDNIASRRQLKENTIREHILEMAFVFYDFPIEKYIPQPIYHQLHKGFETIDNYTYRDAKEAMGHLEFMHYRLVEIERIRMND